MSYTLSNYLVEICQAVDSEDGVKLGYLLRPTSPHGKSLAKELRQATRRSLSTYEKSVQPPLDDICIQYALVVSNVARNRMNDAFKEQRELVLFFLRFFTEQSGWTLPALFAILRDLRDIAADADLYSKHNSQPVECMEEAARIMSKAFKNCVTDRLSPYEQSRKWGIYYVVGLVLKTYFRVKRITLSKNILRALEANKDIPPLSSYPRAHQVTFRYYLGMLHFLNEEYEQAEKELTFAFYNCRRRDVENEQRILAYLIPLRMLRGHLPGKDILDRFPTIAELYTPFVNAIRHINIQAFDAALTTWEQKLVELNLYLTVERARELCIRGLFRKVWVICEMSTRIPLSMFHSAVRVSGMDVVPEETECLVANMIYKGFMRGYISHEKQMVVLAQTSAFPRVADRKNPFIV